MAENRDAFLATPLDAVVPADRLEFPFCQLPRGQTAMDHELICSLTKNAAPLEGAALAEAVAAHELFVKSGGAGGDWQTLEAAGLPLCIYDGSVAIDSSFDGADFRGASLQKVDYSRASLKGCSFAGANLRGADFENADLTGADFTGAVLLGTRFPGAILDRVKR